MTRPRSWDNHRPCPGGCGQLADECECARPNPLGSMTVTEPIGSSDEPRPLADWPNPDPPPMVEKLSDHTRRALFAEMGAQGITDADVQRAAMTRILGREVASRASLTEDEGHTLLDSLRARRVRAEAEAIIRGTDR